MYRRTMLIAPYQLTRVPLSVLDAMVAQRLAEDSAPRMMIDRAIGSFDQVAGRLLSDEGMTQRGTDRIARVTKLATAATLEQEAAQTRAAATAVADRGAAKAAKLAQEADDQAHDGLSEAAKIEREGKQRAAAQARALAAEKKKQAQARKQQREAALTQQVERVEATADGKLSKAEQTAKAKLNDAAHTRANAAESRDHADRLSAITDAKRQARKQS